MFAHLHRGRARNSATRLESSTRLQQKANGDSDEEGMHSDGRFCAVFFFGRPVEGGGQLDNSEDEWQGFNPEEEGQKSEDFTPRFEENEDKDTMEKTRVWLRRIANIKAGSECRYRNLRVCQDQDRFSFRDLSLKPWPPEALTF